MTGIKGVRSMTDELMEQRMAELNAHNAEKSPIPDNEKRAYSVDDIMAILDISRSSAYILIKKNLFRSVKIGNQLRISKASFDEWLDKG
jgi:excisionase family DNA binding protein